MNHEYVELFPDEVLAVWRMDPVSNSRPVPTFVLLCRDESNPVDIMGKVELSLPKDLDVRLVLVPEKDIRSGCSYVAPVAATRGHLLFDRTGIAKQVPMIPRRGFAAHALPHLTEAKMCIDSALERLRVAESSLDEDGYWDNLAGGELLLLQSSALVREILADIADEREHESSATHR